MYLKIRKGLQELRARGVASRAGMSGVTLMELMIVIALVGILLGIGVPSYRSITTSYRISGEINGLLGDMQLARAEAIKEGQAVTICVSTNSTSNNPGCDGTSKNWDKGWIVFPDPNGNRVPLSPDTVLRIQAAFVGGDTFTDGATGYVTFNREGLVNGLNAGGGALIVLHEPTASVTHTRCLQVSSVGALQVTQNATNGSCT